MEKHIYIDSQRVLLKPGEQSDYHLTQRYFSVIAIQNYGSSGSIFLQSLLDHHPNLITLPATNSRGFYTFWHTYSAHSQQNKTHLVQSFVAEHAYLFEPSKVQKVYGLDKMGENADQTVVVDFNLFCTLLLKFMATVPYPSRRHFFIAIHMAYAQSLGRNPASICWIVFPIHGLPAEQAKWLMADFPDIKFVHTLREPLINIASSLKHKIGAQLIGSFVEFTFAQILCGIKQQLYPEPMNPHGEIPYLVEATPSTRAIRLEDLHQHVEDTMHLLTQWLGIPWHPCLQQSTFNGLKWWNRQGSLFISGASQEILAQSYDHYFTWFDRWRLKMVSLKKYQHWQYPVQNPSLLSLSKFVFFWTLLLPFKVERQTFSTRMQLTTQKCVEILTLPVHNMLICLQPLKLGKIIENQSPIAAKEKIETKLKRWLKPLLTLYLWGRDFCAVRYWLYRAWREECYHSPSLVKLLTEQDLVQSRISQFEKAHQLFETKQYVAALCLYQCLAESTTLSLELKEKMSCCGYHTQHWEICSQYGQEVLREHPQNRILYPMVLESLVKQEAWAEAEALNETAKRINLPESDWLIPYVHLGEHFLKTNHSDSAQRVFKWLCEQFANRLDFRFSLAQSYLLSQKWLSAKEQLETIRQAAPENIETTLMLGRVYENLGQKPNALECYQHILQRQPGHMGARQGLFRLR